MSEIKLYENVTVNVPDGFVEMDAAQLEKMYNKADENRVGLVNPVTKAIIVFYRQKLGFIASKLAKGQAMRIRLETSLCRTNPGLKISGEYELTVGADKCYGFGYNFSVQGVAHISEIIPVVKGRQLYTVSCTVPAANGKETVQAFRRMLEGMKL